MNAIPVTRPATITDVLHADATLPTSKKKKAVAAATAFFFLEVGNVASAWRTSVIVAGLVTGIAFIHYMYMREVWVATGDSPTVYRYIDWLITVPLQMVEFYLILAAARIK